jgi:hypothetical protein
MGFRFRAGPVSVGARGMSVNTRPVGYSMSFRGGNSGGGSPSDGEIAMLAFGCLIGAAFWELTISYILYAFLADFGYGRPARTAWIVCAALSAVAFPLAIFLPTLSDGTWNIAATIFVNIVLGIIPCIVILFVINGLQPQTGLAAEYTTKVPAAAPAAPRPVAARPAGAKLNQAQTLASIEKMAALRDLGVLTDAEFVAKKTEMLHRL